MDWLTTSLAFFFFNYFRYVIYKPFAYLEGFRNFICSEKIVLEQIFFPLAMLGIYWLSGYYNDPFRKSRLIELSQTFFTTLINSIIIYLAILINDPLPARSMNYEIILVLFILMFSLVYIGRYYLTSRVIKKFANKEWMFNTVVIGDSENAINMVERLINARTNLGYNIIGYIPIEGEKSSKAPHQIIDQNKFETLRKNHNIDQLIIATEDSDEQKILNLLYQYFSKGIPIKISPLSLSFLTSHIRLQDINAEPFIDLTSSSMSDYQKNMKRVIDILLSSFALIIGSPLILSVALAVKATSKGPVFYTQTRIGYRQKRFKIYKFRSMYVDAEAHGPQLSEEADPRITPFGHFMRKYRLDEIPQFWNILKGDMSLVGPRPEREYYISQIVKEAPYYTLLQQVKPGLTSWGMVKFGYAKSVKEMIERSRFDLIYLSNMSIAVDMKIIIHTVKTVFMGEGL